MEYAPSNRKRLPYGMMNFADIRFDNYYYVDKTAFIPLIEQSDRFFFFIRPRRFGKSLTLSMLQHYYDVRTRDKFDALFGDLYIGKHPTPDRNTYLVLKLNFSGISGELHNYRQGLDAHCQTMFDYFCDIYADYLPQGIKEKLDDPERYQTVYSKIKGSVAAPTAGLHFTPEVLAAIDAQGIGREELTLHVGAGTFKPVKSETIEGHEMHTEYISVSKHTIEKLIAHNGEAIAVGTTSVRTLESLYYIGVLISHNPDATQDELHVQQWMPYEDKNDLTPVEALQQILDYLNRHEMEALHSSTQIIIAPGYTYKIVKKMVTNFHQPQSTLLLLVSAFVKGNWRRIYDYALGHDFRFLSYGDSSLLIP